MSQTGLDGSNDETCVDCVLGKFKRRPFNNEVPKVLAPLERVAADLFGPVRVPSHLGNVYMLAFTDSFSRHTSVFFLASKNAETVHQCFRQYQAFTEKQSGHTLKQLHTDNGKEFDNRFTRDYCESNGIRYTTNAPYSSKRNGLVERRLGIIMDDVRAILSGCNLPPKFWALAANHAVYLRNRLAREGEKTPHELMFGARPRTDHLRVFGCTAYAWIPEVHREEGKLGNRAKVGIFVGFVEGTSKYRIYDPVEKTFEASRDVKFVESTFPAKAHPKYDLAVLIPEDDSPEQGNEPDFDDGPEGPVVEENEPILDAPVPKAPGLPQPAVPRTARAPTTPVAARTRARLQQLRSESPESSDSDDGGSTSSSSEEESASRGTVIREQPVRADSEESNDPLALLASLDAPATVSQALDGSDGKDWAVAIEKEMNSIESFSTYTLHDPSEVPRGAKPISSRLVLAVKPDPTGGDNHKLKARFCAKGFTQRPGIEYFDTFSPTGHRQSFRQFLALVAAHDLEVKGFDVSSAFLHGELEEEVWMKFPPEVATGHRAGKVARLRKSLYGLKQAGKCWNDKIDGWLQARGWSPNSTDACLYTKAENGVPLLMLYLHVDDSAIAGQSSESIDAFAAELDKAFPCTRQGDLKYFLGMEIHRNRSSRQLWITQTLYTQRILERFQMQDCNPCTVPMAPTVRLEKATKEEQSEAADLPYRELVGALQYLTIMTRPDISFAVNKMAQFNSAWGQRHFDIAKGILRYLHGSVNFGISLGNSTESLVGYVDADHQGCIDTRRSTTGWVVMYRGGLIAWKSKRQTCISHSTAESELMALDDSVRDMEWERRGFEALGELTVSAQPTSIFVDNKAAVDLSKNRTSHDSTKHIHSRYLYVRELIQNKVVSVTHIPGSENPADIFTKPLAKEVFRKHRSFLGISEPPMRV